MTIHEFGKENKKIILLLHPSVVRWDYFEYVIPLLEKQYHLMIPALPGYDLDEPSDFTSVEQIADELNAWLKKSGYGRLYHQFGFNRKEQLTRIILFPFVSMLLAWICTLFL